MTKRCPFILAILSIVGGVGISILFAVNEDFFKNKISAGLESNQKIQAILDPIVKAEKTKSEEEKNWRYYQRFHFHATGIGAMMLGLLLVLLKLNAPSLQVKIASYLTAVGGTLYPYVWLFAGVYGPSMGRSEAKEAFAIFGYMGGVFLLGVLFTGFLTARYEFKD